MMIPTASKLNLARGKSRMVISKRASQSSNSSADLEGGASGETGEVER